jgi:serine/threonine protein kinase
MNKNYYRVGDFIEDRYEISRILHGGMGLVYVTLDIAFNQPVVVKTVKYKNREFQKRFITEAQTWIQLERHTNIVQAKSTFLIEQQPYIVVEYIDGGDLRQKLSTNPMDLKTAVDFGLQFCAGAAYAYRKLGLIHRDIKPENLLLTSSGTMKITDFGLSHTREEFNNRKKISGTPLYMSPEQWMDSEAVTKQTDIYAFGVVLYEMLTGQPPFKYYDIKQLRIAHEQKIVTKPMEVNPKIPEQLSSIIMKCLEKNPMHRFIYYEDLAEQLQQVYQVITGQKYIHSDEHFVEMSDSQADLLNSGDSLFTIGRFSDALRYYDRLLELNPNTAQFWQRKGMTLVKLGKLRGAYLYFNEALVLEPSNLDIAKEGIRCLLEMNKQQDALECCSKALYLNPNDRELLKLKRELLGKASDSNTISSSNTPKIESKSVNSQIQNFESREKTEKKTSS